MNKQIYNEYMVGAIKRSIYLYNYTNELFFGAYHK